MNNNLKKNTVWNIIGTGINSFSSLILLIMVTRINEINQAGVFSFAFSTASLFNVIGTYSGRVYQVTERKKITDKEFLINRVISCFAMIIISIGWLLMKKYDSTKLMIILLLCIWKTIEAFCDVLYGFLQKNDELYKVGITLTIKNIIGLTFFILVDMITKRIELAILSYILVYIITILLYDFPQSSFSNICKGKISRKNIFDIFIKGFPTFCITFLNLYLINSSKYAIDDLMNEEYQAVFGIILMPATMMVLISQFMVHPFLNEITNYVDKDDYKDLNRLIIKISTALIIIGIVAIAFCYFIGIYILELIYGISLIEYNACLSIILFGAIFTALIAIISTVLIAMRYTLIQMIVYLIMSLLTCYMSKILVSKYEVVGASLNYTITMILTYGVLILTYLIIRMRKKQLLQ